MITKSIVMCLVGLLLLFASSLKAEMRKWTRTNGQEIEAEFVKFDAAEHKVTLKQQDGKEIIIAMKWLSEADRQYVKQLSRAHSDQLSKRGDAGATTKPTGKAQSSSAPTRTWTQVDGTTIEACYVGTERHESPTGNRFIVTLKKSDGTRITRALWKLSNADKEFVGKILASEGKDAPWLHSMPHLALKPSTPELKPDPAKPAGQVVAPTPSGDTADIGKRKTTTVDSDALKERLDKMKDADVLLRRILKGFPANCATAQVVGTPKPIKQDDQKVTVRVHVKLGVDEAALAAFRKRLLAVLEEFKEESWDEQWTFKQASGRSAAAKKGAAQADSEYLRVKEKDNGQEAGKAATDEITVFVNTERDDAWTTLKWKAFALDQMLTEVFSDATGRHGECVLSIVSKAGDTIPLDRFALDDERLGGITPFADRSEFGVGGRTFFISSTFLRDAACSRHAPTVTVLRDVEIPASLLDRLQALKCEMRLSKDKKAEK